VTNSSPPAPTFEFISGLANLTKGSGNRRASPRACGRCSLLARPVFLRQLPARASNSLKVGSLRSNPLAVVVRDDAALHRLEVLDGRVAAHVEEILARTAVARAAAFPSAEVSEPVLHNDAFADPRADLACLGKGRQLNRHSALTCMRSCAGNDSCRLVPLTPRSFGYESRAKELGPVNTNHNDR
jgi:hypothetical protein